MFEFLSTTANTTISLLKIAVSSITATKAKVNIQAARDLLFIIEPLITFRGWDDLI